MKHQSGFTLIELIMVVVILGILAATALPKFADMRSDANVAAMEGLRGSMDSAIALAHGVQMIKAGGSNTAVSMGGVAVTMLYGYPSSGAAGIMNALDLSGSKYKWATCDSTQCTIASGLAAETHGAIAVSGTTVVTTCYVPYYTAKVTGEKASTGNAVTSGC